MRATLAEWTKLRTVASTPWLQLAAAAVTTAVAFAAAGSINVHDCPPEGCFEDTTKLSLAGVQVAQAVVVIFAALAMTMEYGTRTIIATLAAVPRRAVVLAAKAITVTALTMLAGVAGVLGSLLVGRATLPGNGLAAPSLADEPTLRAAVGSVLYLVLIALLSLGAGALIRDSAGAITTVLLLLYAAPFVAQLISSARWQERLEKYAPSAGLAIQATTRLDRLPIGPWAGLGVLACYAAGALALGTIAFHRRDA